MAAVVGVLLYEDGKALNQWALFIPPNAVVSFITTLAKSSLLLTTIGSTSDHDSAHEAQ